MQLDVQAALEYAKQQFKLQQMPIGPLVAFYLSFMTLTTLKDFLVPLKNFLELLSFLATILGAGALVATYLSWLEGRKTLHFSVIASCATRYQKLADDLANAEKPLTVKKARQYLDLCNEELFYFETDYLPLPVVLEWLDGMLSSIPLRRAPAKFDDSMRRQECANTPEKEMPAPFFENRDLWQLIAQYPRLDYVFTLNEERDWEAIERAARSGPATAKTTAMLSLLQRNLKSYKQQHPFQSLLISRWNPRQWGQS